jgi:hypothetical protein
MIATREKRLEVQLLNDELSNCRGVDAVFSKTKKSPPVEADAVFLLLECSCDDEGDWVAGVFSSLEAAREAKAIDVHRRAVEDGDECAALSLRLNHHANRLRIVKMEVDILARRDVRDPIDGLLE